MTPPTAKKVPVGNDNNNTSVVQQLLLLLIAGTRDLS